MSEAGRAAAVRKQAVLCASSAAKLSRRAASSCWEETLWSTVLPVRADLAASERVWLTLRRRAGRGGWGPCILAGWHLAAVGGPKPKPSAPHAPWA